MESSVSKVTNLTNFEDEQTRMMKVEFNCIVKMFDSGSIEFGDKVSGRTLSPQFFKSEMRLTLEFIRLSEPVDIGLAIKKQLKKMDEAITLYEKKGAV